MAFLLRSIRVWATTLIWAVVWALPGTAQHTKGYDDSLLVESKIHIMTAFVRADVATAEPDAEQSCLELLEMSKKANDEQGMADAYALLAQLYAKKEQPEISLYYGQKAMALYLKNGDNSGLAAVIHQQGLFEVQAGHVEPALQKFQTALALAETAGDESQQVNVLESMGVLFLKLRKYTDAETYLKRAKDMAEDGIDLPQMMQIELDLGNLYLEQEQYPKAQARYERCLDLLKILEYPDLAASCKTNFGNLYIKQGKYDLALDMYTEPLDYYQWQRDTLKWTSVLASQAEVFTHKGMYAQATESLNSALTLTQRMVTLDALILKSRLSRQLYILYQKMGRFEKALQAYEQHNAYEKTVFSQQTANNTAELKEKYQTEKKEQENLALKRNGEIQSLQLQNQRNVLQFFLLVLLFIGVLVLLLLRNNKIRFQQKNMQLEQRLLRSQMNPHFIFNALTAIQSFMYKNEAKEAGMFLSSFARLVRSILENSREEFVPVAKEIQWLKNYVKLQQLRFENEIECHIEFDETLDMENTWIPPMLVQPFIENALEHGLSQSETQGMLTIKYTRYKKWLAIHIRDNGSGFDSKASPKPRQEHASMALKITRERLKLLNRGKRKKIDLHIFSIPGSGTLVSFSIPLIIHT